MRFSDAEWKVMNAVWEEHPASVRDVLEHVEGDAEWAYTTVKTMLTRLADKGALRTTRRANAMIFRPAISRDEARDSAVKSLLDQAFGGAVGSLFLHLAKRENLSRKDSAELRAMVDELDERLRKNEPAPNYPDAES